MTEPMRILTVRQPWAWAIVHAGKDVENRVRNIAGSYRGPVAIHAAQATDFAGWLDFGAPDLISENPVGRIWTTDIRGAIVGVVDLVDVHVARAAASGRLVDWAEHTKPEERCSPWAEWDAYHLVLANPRALDEPIPYKGALGLRTLDAATTAAINDQLSKEQS